MELLSNSVRTCNFQQQINLKLATIFPWHLNFINNDAHQHNHIKDAARRMFLTNEQLQKNTTEGTIKCQP